MMMRRNAKAAMIRSLPLFAQCSARELTQVARIADELLVPAGRTLATENADGHEFVVMIDGSAQVRRGPTVVADLRAGDFFGETALLTGRPRNATVVSTTDSRILVVEGHAFLRLLEDVPRIRVRVEAALSARLPEAG